jgi:hypothetical protein
LETDRGNTLVAGNPNGGSIRYSGKLNEGEVLIAFTGGIGYHIHNLSFYTRSIKPGSDRTSIRMKIISKQADLISSGMDPVEAAIKAISQF